MRLQQDLSDPLPDYILGGIIADDFLDQHLNQVTHPLIAGFGLLADANSTVTSAWTTHDASRSFNRQLEHLIQAPPAPPLRADPVILTPRMVTKSKCVRAVQVSNTTRYQDADVQFEVFQETKVCVFSFLKSAIST